MEDKINIRKEKLAEYFFNLSNTIAGSAVIGVLVSFAMGVKEELISSSFALLVSGVIMAIIFAGVGNRLLKNRDNE